MELCPSLIEDEFANDSTRQEPEAKRSILARHRVASYPDLHTTFLSKGPGASHCAHLRVVFGTMILGHDWSLQIVGDFSTLRAMYPEPAVPLTYCSTSVASIPESTEINTYVNSHRLGLCEHLRASGAGNIWPRVSRSASRGSAQGPRTALAMSRARPGPATVSETAPRRCWGRRSNSSTQSSPQAAKPRSSTSASRAATGHGPL
mmetsp:Transcript_7220/g.20429  ORF Transcript_7220/g.20429 Transcript_7220/m.20429 type:complete len:205 (-) Transcript_7220:541-1155(-)